MGKKHDILYVNFYTGGSAAHKIELAPPQPKQQEPVPVAKPRPKKRTVVYVDPLAVASILVSAVLMVLMVVGMMTLTDAHTQEARMEAYVQSLQQENARLQAEFDENYDPEAVEKAALALGMVPVDQVEHRTIIVPAFETPVAEPTLWEQIQAFFAGLFA